MLRCLSAQYEQTYSSYYGSDFWSMSMGKDDDGNDQTFEEYVKNASYFPDETEHHPYQKGR